MEFHLAVIKGFLVGACGEYLAVGIPGLYGRVYVQHIVIVTPLDNLATVNIPGKIDQQTSRRKIFREDPVKVFMRNFPLEKTKSPGSPGFEILCFVFKIDDGDIFIGYDNMPQKDRERAFRNGTIPDD
jgi:hypothetical protein